MFRPKTAEREYEKSMLPKNRKEVFLDVVKLNWPHFLLYGGLILLIALPVHLSELLGDLYQIRVSEAVREGTVAAEQAVTLVSSSENTQALIDIVLYTISAIGFSGLARVIRQYAWEENVYFRYEYLKGIRQNAASYALLGALTGMVRFACRWFGSMLMFNSGNAYDRIGALPTAWTVIFLVPAAAYLMVCIPVYDVRFYQNVKTAFMVYFRNFWKSMLAVILFIAFLAVSWLPGVYLRILGRIVISMAAPFLFLGWFLYAFDRLDHSVNEKFYPQLVGKGIYQERMPYGTL